MQRTDRRRRTFIKAATGTLFAGPIAILTSGCQVGPDYYGPPRSCVAPDWTPEPEDSASVVTESLELCRWWRQFDDPVIDRLMYRSVANNPGLREAALRIFEARARLCTVSSDLFPQVNSDGMFMHQKLAAGNFSTGGIGADLTRDSWSWGLNANWEIDVFGRLQRLVEAADADVGEKIEIYRNTMIILMADIARNYVDARTAQQRLMIVEQNIALQRRTLDIVTQKFEGGLTGELDVAQATANLRSSESELPSIKLGYRRAVNRLSILIGCPPGEVDAMMKQVGPIPRAPDRILVGIPAELLRNRPDIRQAERKVAAQTARIGAAVGELYPKFSISGTFGLDSREFATLFHSDSLSSSFGPSFRWNILNFGKFRCNVVAQEFRQRQYIAQYETKVLQAAEEVDNTIAAYVREREQYELLSATVAAYSRAAELAEKRYASGTANFQRVIDSQRSLLTFQNRLVQSDSNITNSVIALYRALGGSWECLPIDPDENVTVVMEEI